jgi:hypothetical protein
MKKKVLSLGISFVVLLVILVLSACSSKSTTTLTTTVPATTTTATTTSAAPITVNIGGTFALTGAYAEDSAACLQGFQDYAKWVNESHILAPWYTDVKIAPNITVNVVWGDDQLDPAKALTIYDQQKSSGMLVERVSGSPEGLALMQRFADDKMGATSQAAGPWLLKASQNIFPNYPIYTDSLAAVADWFLANWKDTTRKPNVAYLTANSALGKGMDTPEMKAYLISAGYNFAGIQYVDQVPTSPPTTALSWLKDNNVDLAIGVMINPGSQPTIKEAVRLGMGTNQPYKITFGFATPNHLQQFTPAMGAAGEGVVVGGSYAPWEDTGPGITFAKMLLNKYHADKPSIAPLYLGGIVEAMTQLEAIRLASLQKPLAQLTCADVLNNGFYKISGLNTGGITGVLTYGPSYTEGVDKVTVVQQQNSKVVILGYYQLHNLFAK